MPCCNEKKGPCVAMVPPYGRGKSCARLVIFLLYGRIEEKAVPVRQFFDEEKNKKITARSVNRTVIFACLGAMAFADTALRLI